MGKLALFGAWLGATVVAVVLAAAAVGSVRGGVTDQPQAAAPLDPDTIVDATTTSSTATSTTAPSTSTSTTSGTSTTSTTAAPSSGTSTSTTTSTTAAPASPEVLPPYGLLGGTVTISVAAPNVSLVAAVPAPGYRVDVEKAGPDEVRVEFESATSESEFRARWSDGELVVEISND